MVQAVLCIHLLATNLACWVVSCIYWDLRTACQVDSLRLQVVSLRVKYIS